MLTQFQFVERKVLADIAFLLQFCIRKYLFVDLVLPNQD
jgi:hypothetical protein